MSRSIIGLTDATRVLVTGPHRSGTTLATEIIADELGLSPVRESEIAHPRFEGDDEPDLRMQDIEKLCACADRFALQGATTFQWLPHVASYFGLMVVVRRNPSAIRASQRAYRGRLLDEPDEKYAKLAAMNLTIPVLWVSYEHVLSQHHLFVRDRAGWEPRQTSPS